MNFTICYLILITFLFTSQIDGFSQNINKEVVRGLSWYDSIEVANKTLKKKYGLEVNQQKTNVWYLDHKDEGEWRVYNADIDGSDVDLILKFVDNKLVEIIYNFRTDEYVLSYLIYEKFYKGVRAKYNESQKHDKNIYTNSDLKKRIVDAWGCAQHFWDLKERETFIQLSACRLLVGLPYNVQLKYYSPKASMRNQADKF